VNFIGKLFSQRTFVTRDLLTTQSVDGWVRRKRPSVPIDGHLERVTKQEAWSPSEQCERFAAIELQMAMLV
jgi:hypothetical protein